MFPLLLTPFLSSLSLSLSLLLTIPPTQAENSLLYNIQSPQNGSFLRASTLNSTTSKVGIIGNPGQATSMYISDVQNINNATIVAGNLLSSSSSSSSEVSSEEEKKENVPFFLLDIYKVRSGGFPSSQVFFRSDLTYEEIGWDQQISIADGHVNYYTGDFGFVFYCTCLPPPPLLFPIPTFLGGFESR